MLRLTATVMPATAEACACLVAAASRAVAIEG